ncbi:MAG: LysM peptidoglycan-binding domain-containing protein, partial [Planctomycetota bacterium]
MRHHLTLAATAILAVAVGCGSTGTKQAAADKKAEDTRPAKKQAEQQAQQEKSAESAPADTAPAGSTSTGAAPSYSVVSLDKGQTLSSLARENDVSVDQILAANDHIDDPRKIPVGQPIFIPTTQKAGGEASAQSSGDTGEKSGSAAAQTDGETKTETTTSADSAEPKKVSPSELHKGQQDARFWWPTSGEITRTFGSTF